MNGIGSRSTVTLLALAWIAFSATPPSSGGTPDLDPEAVALLRRTTEYLGSLERFSANAQTTFEDLLDTGHRVDYELWSNVVVKRPNKVRTERHGDHVNQVFYYDGKTLTLHNPSDRVYATEPAPDTIDDMFQFAYDAFGISTPVSDLVHAAPFPVLMKDVNLAVVVGKEVLRGSTCDHLLFSRPGVDFQIWVADSGPPLPIKYVVTDTTTPELLAISTVISDWDLAPDAPDSVFRFEPPEDAHEISFLPADTTGHNR